MISIISKAAECFILAAVFGLLPIFIGFVLGWIMNNIKHIEHLKELIIQLDKEGKLLPGEKETLLKAVEELKEEH